jgi:hypothetical protein
MKDLIAILIRHGLASAGGFFAANNITGSSTVSIIVGLIILAIPTLWSWAAKMLKLDASKGGMNFITGNEGFRILLGSLVSQGITALSIYFAIDANQPELLAGALINAGLSKAGLHQKVVGVPAVKLMMACLCLLSLSSCSFLASQAGQTLILSLTEIGLKAAVAKGKVSEGDSVTIQKGLAVVTNPNDDTVMKVFTLAELGLKSAVEKGVLKQGDAMLIQEASVIIKSAVVTPQETSSKQPVKVLPTAAVEPRQNRLKPGLQYPDGPDCMQLADRIPVYGERVAFMLSTADVK